MIMYKPINSGYLLEVLFYYYEDKTYDIEEITQIDSNGVRHKLSIKREFEIEDMFYTLLED